MSDYGVIPTGFSNKTLDVLLAEIEQKNADRFGSDIVQDDKSPLGQFNGLFADIVSDVWETFKEVYQSFDVDGAEGPRLDIIAKFQRLQRLTGELDVNFRTRITNEGMADIKLSKRINDLAAIDGVTFAWIIENSSHEVNEYGMPPHSVAHAVIGGDDEEVAAMVYENAIGGIGLFGDYPVSIEADGFCRTIDFIRPIDVPIRVELDVRHIADACQCAPPSIGTITQFVIDAFAGECGYKNGDTVTEDRVAAEAAQIGNMKIVDCRIARTSNSLVFEEIETTIFERPVIISPNVIVRYV
jgi:hypothetical protein